MNEKVDDFNNNQALRPLKDFRLSLAVRTAREEYPAWGGTSLMSP